MATATSGGTLEPLVHRPREHLAPEREDTAPTASAETHPAGRARARTPPCASSARPGARDDHRGPEPLGTMTSSANQNVDSFVVVRPPFAAPAARSRSAMSSRASWTPAVMLLADARGCREGARAASATLASRRAAQARFGSMSLRYASRIAFSAFDASRRPPEARRLLHLPRAGGEHRECRRDRGSLRRRHATRRSP